MNLHSSSVQQHDAYPLLFLMMCITPSELDHQQKPRKATPQTGEDTLNSHLPPGWQSYMSPQGRRYYVNTFTNALQLSYVPNQLPCQIYLRMA